MCISSEDFYRKRGKEKRKYNTKSKPRETTVKHVEPTIIMCVIRKVSLSGVRIIVANINRLSEGGILKTFVSN